MYPFLPPSQFPFSGCPRLFFHPPLLPASFPVACFRSLPAPGNEPAFLDLAESLSHDLARPLVAYCSSIDCTDALDLALALRDRGFTDVRLYPGGFAEWSRWGGPLETGDAP